MHKHNYMLLHLAFPRLTTAIWYTVVYYTLPTYHVSRLRRRVVASRSFLLRRSAKTGSLMGLDSAAGLSDTLSRYFPMRISLFVILALRWYFVGPILLRCWEWFTLQNLFALLHVVLLDIVGSSVEALLVRREVTSSFLK